ncbi:MAG: hypothetical protein CM15mP128_0200 [Methanobacteriota archaeon]|nr:MAG: hypothetical protein CM15mP128_0200 [Euryarchaeota archaeon]
MMKDPHTLPVAALQKGEQSCVEGQRPLPALCLGRIAGFEGMGPVDPQRLHR